MIEQEQPQAPIRLCPHCGQPILIADTPAKDEPQDEAPATRRWREREPLL